MEGEIKYVLKKLASKIIRILYNIKMTIGPKRSLNRNTIIIRRSSWELFDAAEYDSSQYDFIIVNDLREIKKSSYDHIVAYIGSIDISELKHLRNLKWLQIASHGFNGFDDKKIYANHLITVTNLHAVFSKPIANFCVTAWYTFHCPAFLKKISANGKASNNEIETPISVIIYGLGDIGNEIAKACHQQSWKVYGVKQNIPSNIPSHIEDIVSIQDSFKYLQLCDYVINILPETPKTIGIFNASFFAHMKTNAIFCNVGRGASVVDKDLDLAIQNGIINGAILDACSHYAYCHPNIILTNHSSSFSSQNNNRINAFFSTQLEAFLSNDMMSLNNKIPLQ